MDTNPLISKSFTIGIILLFVGMSIIPSTAQKRWKNIEESSTYIRAQPGHHNAYLVDDQQQRLPTTAAE